jgi:hypothetical protein
MAGEVAVAPAWYDVQIKKVSNGFIAQVGCKTFVAKTWAELAAALSIYWKDPQKARRMFAEDDPKLEATRGAKRDIHRNRPRKKR